MHYLERLHFEQIIAKQCLSVYAFIIQSYGGCYGLFSTVSLLLLCLRIMLKKKKHIAY